MNSPTGQAIELSLLRACNINPLKVVDPEMVNMRLSPGV